MKNTLEGVNSRKNKAEKQMTELENRMVITADMEQKKEYKEKTKSETSGTTSNTTFAL